MPLSEFMSVEIIGFVAAFFTSASFLPQAVMVIRSRKTDGLSLTMYMMFTLGIGLWLTYGLVFAVSLTGVEAGVSPLQAVKARLVAVIKRSLPKYVMTQPMALGVKKQTSSLRLIR